MSRVRGKRDTHGVGEEENPRSQPPPPTAGRFACRRAGPRGSCAGGGRSCRLGRGGRVSMESIRARFSAEEIQRAIELHRTIHPVSIETRQGTATFYEAN